MIYLLTTTALFTLLVSSVAAQAPLPLDSLVGIWRVCFVLDSTVQSSHSTRMTCGVMRVQKLGAKAPVFMRSGEDSVKIDAVLHFDHDLRFASMLGAEPGGGAVGSGTLVSAQGEVRLYLNAERGQMVFDDRSVHAVGRRSNTGVIAGMWQLSCIRPCDEKGAVVMRRVR